MTLGARARARSRLDAQVWGGQLGPAAADGTAPKAAPAEGASTATMLKVRALACAALQPR